MPHWRYNFLDALARRLPFFEGQGGPVVVYTPGHLGDILHAVPMLKAMRQGKPEAKIVWLVGPWSEALARRYARYVDEIRIFGPNLPPFTRGKREWQQNAWQQWRMALEWRRQGVEVFIGPMDRTGRFLANAICPRLWIGIGDRRPPRVRAEIETIVQAYEKDRYEADAWCGLLRPLGIVAYADRLEYKVTPEERAAAEAFLRAEGVDIARPLALIAPGSGWSGKNWLPERFAEVAEWLSGFTLGDLDRTAPAPPGSAGMPRPTESQYEGFEVGRTLRVSRDRGFQIAWVGGPGEEQLVPASRAKDFNWVGKTSIQLLAGVMEKANLFIGNDGGLLHIAAALNLPTVSIWGPTSPGKWGPKGPLHRQIRKVDRCEGCIYWDYRETCRHDHACMKAVTVEDVHKAITGLAI